METPERGYFLSGLLALGLHAGVIFGWQGRPNFEPAEYGVISGESAIEVALVAAPPDPVEVPEEVTLPEPVEAQETTAEVVEPPEAEPTATPIEQPVFDTVQEEPRKPETTLQARPEPTPAISASKPRAVAARKDRAASSLPSGQVASDSAAFRPRSGSQSSKPAYLYNPHPAYPEAARKAGQTGVVTLRVSINERGRVTVVSLIKSSGHSLLDERARTAVQRWIFRPARQGGKPVATQVDVPVRFSLDH